MWVLSLLLGLLVVLAITAGTGYFVAQEFSYMAVDRSRLQARVAAGGSGAKAAERALSVTRRTSFMLSGAQLGITVTALLVGYVAEPLIGEALGGALGGVGIPTGVGLAIGTTAALLVSTVIQMVFGELVPKNLAIARPEPVATRLAASTNVYLGLFGWIIRIFDSSSNLLLRALKIEPVHDVDQAVSRHDLGHIVAQSEEAGDLPAELSLLLDRVLDFPERDVAHAMVPRARVDVVEAATPVTDLVALMAGGHSRYPVVDPAGDGLVGTADDIVLGTVHLQDVLAATAATPATTTTTAGAPAATARDLARPAVLVPTTMPLPRVLATLAEAREELAVVLDEHGSLAGVITVEDLAEELVGEIEDEHDLRAPGAGGPDPLAPDEDGAWVLPGTVPLDEVGRLLGRDVGTALEEAAPDDVETLAGLVIALHGALPVVGDVVEDTGPDGAPVTYEVLAVERHVPSLVRVRPAVAAALAPASEEEA